MRARLLVLSLIATSCMTTSCTAGELAEDTEETGTETGGDDTASTEDSDPSDSADSTASDTATTDTATTDTAVAMDTAPVDTGPPSGAAAVCARWKADRASLAYGTWSGNVAGCEAGDLGAPGRANTLKLVNLYRWLAGMPAVTENESLRPAAQACALMMQANGALNHTPPSTWKCYSSAGASTAGKGSLSPTASVPAIDLYMVDPGNATTMGHRRWILSNSLGPIGMGGASSYSCLQVIGGSGSAGKAYVAWPPAGIVPYAIFTALLAYSSIDATGWTVQSDSISFPGGTTATVTEDGVNKPVTVTTLGNGYGSTNAIRVTPMGWTTKADKTYAVSVKGASKPIDYTVQVVSCP